MNYQFSLHHSDHLFLNGQENLYSELGSERVKPVQSTSPAAMSKTESIPQINQRINKITLPIVSASPACTNGIVQSAVPGLQQNSEEHADGLPAKR